MKRIIIVNSKGGTGKSTIALSLADTLNGAKLIDLDPQGTITTSASFTGRHTPVKDAKNTNATYLIYDTPPYNNSTSHADIFKLADYILIPTKASTPDLLATTAIINQLNALKLSQKAYIVINEVRKPHNKAYKEAKQLIKKNFEDVIKIANTELSNLTSFRRILTTTLHGKAKEQLKTLVSEIGIKNI